MKERGIAVYSHYLPLHSSPAGIRYCRVGSGSDTMEATFKVVDWLLRLPVWPDLSDAQIRHVTNSLIEIVLNTEGASTSAVTSSNDSVWPELVSTCLPTLHDARTTSSNIHICVLAATRRGLLFIQKIRALIPDAKFTVFSFKEDANEPPFLESIRSFVQSMENSSFYEARQLGHQKHAGLHESLGEVDGMFCVSCRYVIPSRVSNITRERTFVFHDFLLPLYSGVSPPPLPPSTPLFFIL